MTAPIRYDGENVDPAPLGKPLHFEFSGRTAPTRFMKGAMTEQLASWDAKDTEKSGIPTASLENLYKRWAEGGFGVVLTGNIMLDHDQIEAPGNMIVPTGATTSGPRFDGFKTLASAGKANGTLLVAQLNHPGRQISSAINPHPVSASEVQLQGEFMGMTFGKPRAASKADIAHIIERFASAAAFLEAAGFDGVQLHAAHGYLLAQFLSQTTNLRTDEYGGSVENRARILVEIGQAVRARTKPNFVLGIKLNSVEFQEKGISGEEAREVAALLERNKFDFIELSGGTYEKLSFEHKRESTVKREAFFIEFAEMIAPALHRTKTYIIGGLKSGGAMVAALGSVDGVGLARPAAQEPHLPRDILDGKVRAAIKQAVDQQDFGITNVAAGTQMRQVGKDHRPVDLSSKANVDAFLKDVESWKEKLAKDKERKVFGYPDVLSAEISPYGSFPVAG